MSKTKKTNRFLTLGIVLLVLLAAAILLADPFGWLKPSDEEQAQADPTQRVLCDFAKDDITAIVVTKPGEDPFRLELKDAKWYLSRGDKSYRANQERVDKFLEDLPQLRSEGLATDKLDKHGTFEVDASTGIKLEVYTSQDQPAVQLIVGKADPSYQRAFARLGDAPEVYRTSRNIKSLVGFAFNDYRSKTPWAFDPTLLTKIQVRPPDGKGELKSFTKSGEFWQTAEGKNANQNMLNELAKKISELSINQFMDEPDENIVKLAGVQPSLVFTAADGEYKLTVGAKESTNYYIADQDGRVYQIAEYYLKPYTELAFDQLSFDDTQAAEAAADSAKEDVVPDEGLPNGLPSDAEEDAGK